MESPTPAADRKPRGKTGRRAFLGLLVTAPTLTVAANFGLDTMVGPKAIADPLGVGEFVDLQDAIAVIQLPVALDMVVEITPENRVRVEFHRAEIGQGITTMIAMLVAEELDARLSDVDVELADADALKVLNIIAGSHTTRAFYHPTRKVAAAARARLLTAASKRWGVPANQLRTQDTKVIAPDGRTATYASLSESAAKIVVPAVSPAPKDASDFRLIGKSTGRVDSHDVVRGRAKWTQDLTVEGALPTVVARPPTIGGKVKSVDSSVAEGMSGVVAVTRIPTGVAVSARTFYEAMKARDALKISWKDGPVVGLSDKQIREKLRSAVPPVSLPPVLTKKLDLEFEFAYVSHSPMEVRNAIADVRNGRAEVWSASQLPIHSQQRVAEALLIPLTNVTLHAVRAGGGFGSRLYVDAAVEAALVSQAIKRPVKLMWTRVDETKHGYFRPAAYQRIRAHYTDKGDVVGFDHRVGANELDVSWGLGDAVTTLIGRTPGTSHALTQAIFQMTQQVPYHFGLAVETLYEVPIKVPSAPWRSVYSGHVVMANEMAVDELARRVKQDPVEFRLAKLKYQRVKDVLKEVAERGRWGRSLPKGRGQGIAIHYEYKSAVAYLVEVDTTGDEARVTDVHVAVDVGQCINPKGLEAQLQGCLVDAISTTFWAGIHVDDGAIRESSFSDFRYARMRQVPPKFTMYRLQGSNQPGGVGELGYPAAAAAIANAYTAATGSMPTRFPIFADGGR